MEVTDRSWIGRVTEAQTETLYLVAITASDADEAMVKVSDVFGGSRPLNWHHGPYTLEQWAASQKPSDPAFELAYRLDPLKPVVFAIPKDDGVLEIVDPLRDAGSEQLVVTPIGEVEPLGDQFGQYPARFVPETLEDVLFSQDGPATYCLIDAAKISSLTIRLEAEKVNYRSLFKNEVAEELADVAPYLVELRPDANFTRDLFTETPQNSPSHLHAKDACIIFQSSEGMDKLWSHVRKYTRLQDNSGGWYFLRYWDRDFRDYITKNPAGPFPRGFFDHMVAAVCRLDGNQWFKLQKQNPEDQLCHEGFFDAFRTHTKLSRRNKFLARVAAHFSDDLNVDLDRHHLELIYRQARDRGFETERGIVRVMECLYLWRENKLSETKVLKHPDLHEHETYSDPMRAGALLEKTKEILEYRK